ncbi:MAG: NAD(P)/FAD-dependent oxidoreductase [Planctomycetaceae bacterium]
MTPTGIISTESVWRATLSAAERVQLQADRGRLLHTRPDVLIVGGGLVGLCLAYYLAEEGTCVQLIEASSLGDGASGANAGGVWPNDQGPSHPPGFQSLAFLSRDLWSRLSVRPGFDFDWRVNGFLNVNSDRIGPDVQAAARAVQEQGYAGQAVDGEQIRRLEPQLRPDVAYGLHAPSDAHLHPLKAAASLARAARALGAGIATGIRAVDAECDDVSIQRVETTAGPIAARHVVAATGWSRAWVEAAAQDLYPLRPVRGQLIATAPLPPLLAGSVAGGCLVVQLKSGEIIAGGDVVESDSLTPDPAVSARFAKTAGDLIPALRDVRFERAWCGLRPGTPDGLPVIDRSTNTPNLWLACGHFRNGVLLAPGTGKLLSAWIRSGERPAELAPFCWARFSRARDA